MARGKRRDDEGAASGVIAFMIAGILFMASIVAVLATTRTANDRESTADATDSARFAIQANSLADILLGSPGYFRAADGTLSPLDWSHDATYEGKTQDADRLERLGLLDANAREPSMMDFAKFQNLRRAGYFADAADGYVNYEEAVRNLGLSNAGLDFHIRAYPTLDSVADLLAASKRDNHLRVAYVGDIDVQTTTTSDENALADPFYKLEMTAPVCSVDSTLHPGSFRFTSKVYNRGNDPAHPTQFTAVTSIDLDPSPSSKPQQQNTNSFLVPAGGEADLFVDVAAIAGRDCITGGDRFAEFQLYDPVHAKIVSPLVHTKTTDFGSVSTPATRPTRGLILDTDLQNYRSTVGTVLGDPVLLNYDGTNLAKDNQLFLRVCVGEDECVNDAAVFTSMFQAVAADKKRQIDVGILAEGEYTAWLYDCVSGCSADGVTIPATNLRVTERVLVTPEEIGGYVPPVEVEHLENPIFTALAGPPQEVYNLELLMGKFCPAFFNSKVASPLGGWAADNTDADWVGRCASFKGVQAHPGDVYPDSKKIMNEDLPNRLVCQVTVCHGGGLREPGSEARADVAEGEPRYDLTDVLVVGSGVDHNAMTSQSAKGAIESWVHGGGTILVFGSTEGNVRWLEPLFHAAIVGTGEAISTPDQGHPMLHTPNELDNPGVNYETHESAWRFNGQTAKAQGTNEPVFSNIVVAGDDEPVLALSNKGSFGGGTIIVTAFMPYDIYGADPTGDDPTWLRDPTCSRPYNSATDSSSRTLEQCEGMFFMHNMLMQGYADLFLEYGPDIPANANVQPSQRLAQIVHPQFEQPIELTMIVYVFKSV